MEVAWYPWTFIEYLPTFNTTSNKVSSPITIVDITARRGGVTQWVARLTRNVEVVGSSSIKGPVVSITRVA